MLLHLSRSCRLYLELGKARLSALVVFTALSGYLLAPVGRADWAQGLAVGAGTLLAALGANGLNQVLERDRDALMDRTRGRPLPTRRITPPRAAAWSIASIVVGGAWLLAEAGAPAAALAVGNALLYVAVYTPLKVRSTLNTLVGAVCGAVPPLIGWSARTGGLEAGAWLLALVLFVWQIPHFLALAWLFRDDYARGGYRMLTDGDRSGRRTFRFMIVYSVALLPVGLTLTLGGLTGPVFGAVSLLLGGALAALGMGGYRERSALSARRVFLGSIAYLPLLLAAMLADRGGAP